MERRFSHGNLKNGMLKDILKKDILTFKKDKICECQSCEFRYACFDCRPDSISNNIYEKPWYCTYTPATGKWEDPEEYAKKILSKTT